MESHSVHKLLQLVIQIINLNRQYRTQELSFNLTHTDSTSKGVQKDS